MSMDIKDLKELRIQLGITQNELSKHLKVSRSSIGFWETGIVKISSANLFNYEQFLQDVIDGKIKPRISQNAGRNFLKESEQRALAEAQVTIADVLPKLPGETDIKDLRELRIQLGISYAEAAKWLKVSSSLICGWEKGHNKPSSESLFNYKQFLQDVIDGKIKVKTSSSTPQKEAKAVLAVPKIETPITPKYYKGRNGIEAIDFIEAFNLNFNLGNVIKYVSRAGKKTENALEDLQKAHWYLEREIERRKKS